MFLMRRPCAVSGSIGDVKSLLAVAAVLLVASSAYAEERTTTASVGLVFGAHTPDEPLPGGNGEYAQGEGFGGPRLTLAWEKPALPYPERPGYAVDVGLVPELIAGAFFDDEKAEGMVGVGIRGELRMSQKQQGLLRVSMRGVFYVGARALVVGEQRDVHAELVFGEYILFGRTGRIGFEIGGQRRSGDTMEQPQAGVVGQLYLGWRM